MLSRRLCLNWKNSRTAARDRIRLILCGGLTDVFSTYRGGTQIGESAMIVIGSETGAGSVIGMKESVQQYSDTIEELLSKIQMLEEENRLLKERLEEAGVSYVDIVSDNDESMVELYDLDQGARIKKFDVTDKIASEFFMMFCRGRKDVYDLRYTNPKTGKNGYYTQCHNRWDRNCHIQKRDGVRCRDCELRDRKSVV